MGKTNKDFEVFKREFEKYQKLFGLIGFNIFYSHEPLEHKFATILYSIENAEATVKLSNTPPCVPEGNIVDVRALAKHEAIHLLLSRLVWYTNQRCVMQGVLEEAEEEIVVKLEGLIP